MVVLASSAVERSAEASGALARAAAQAEATALAARVIEVPPLPAPVPDMLYVEVDGTGVPVRLSESEGRTGKDGDRTGTREVKLARLFELNEKGGPVMDPDSSSYTSCFDGKDALQAGQRRVPAPRR